MATITSSTTGNFSAGATWIGGVVPGPADDAVAATGTVVTIDTNVTVLSFQQAGTGKFVLPGGRTVTGNVTINAGTITSGGTIEVTATAGQTATINGNISGANSTIAANIAGVVMTGIGTFVLNGNMLGTGANVSSPNEHCCVYTNVACTINVNGIVQNGTTAGALKRGIWIGPSAGACAVNVTGTVNGSNGSLAHGIVSDVNNSVITVNGTVNGGNTAGGIFSSGATVNIIGVTTGGANLNGSALALLGVSTVGNITGNVFAGSTREAVAVTGASAVANIVGNVTASAGAVGVLVNGASAITNITGTTTGTGGFAGVNATGASSTVSVIGSIVATGALSHGITSSATTNGVVFQGNLTDSLQGATAIWARLVRMTATNSGTTTYTNTVGYPNGTPVTRVSPNLVTGMPATNNVRNATIYGFNNELTGTMKVPPAGSVALGVPVDTSVGTAALDAGSVIAVVGAQVAAASSNPSVV